MKELTIINHDGIHAIDSREVADMVARPHNDLLKTIHQYCKYLAAGDFSLSEYFIPSSYIDKSGRSLPCYLLTKLGCDMVANKMTGEKGTWFTAAYAKRFREMESALTGRSLPSTYLDALKALVASEEEKQIVLAELDRSKEWYSIKRVASINGVSHKKFNWRDLKAESVRRNLGPKKIFDANYGEVNTYHMSVWEAVYPEYEL